MATSIQAFNEVFNGFRAQDSFFRDQVKTITFTIESAASYDPVTLQPVTPTTQAFSAEGFRFDVTDKEFTDVIAGDLGFNCQQSELGRKPLINDHCVIDGVTYVVIEVIDRGQVVWGLQLRG